MAKQGFPMAPSGVLRTAIDVMDAAWWRFTLLDRGMKRRKGQADIDRAADRIADRPARDQTSRITAT
jgi:hypothetical protein